jgi:hypothetical protein
MPNAYRHGDHVCSIHATEEEQLTVAAGFIADGIGRGDRGVYVAESAETILRFRAALGATGLDAGALAARGALIELTHAQTYLSDGRFDADRMLAMLGAVAEQALAAGFFGLRACGDMSWLAAAVPGCEQAAEYEARLNRILAGARICVLCQYHRRRLPPRAIDMALTTHSTAVVEGQLKFNPFFQAVLPGMGAASGTDAATGR